MRLEAALERSRYPSCEGQLEDWLGLEDETGFSLIVGVDGINSIDVKLSNINSIDARLSKCVGLGMSDTGEQHDRPLATKQRRLYAIVRVRAAYGELSSNLRRRLSKPAQAKKQFLDLYYKDFDQDSRDLILKVDDDSVIPRPMGGMRIGHKWPHRAG
ncbi:hypothetical protein F4823DRAFT_566022 [Ustulina deusta]|nr:hypothetical protein F4823DRAFT_566022 [Ustulina deusta]